MIHNTHRSLCLEDSAPAGTVLLKKCSVDLDSQQWVWVNQGMLMCMASSRCLSAQHRDPVHTRSCHGPEVDAAALIWDCDRDRLISRNSSMLLSVDGRRLTLSQDSKHSRWRSLDGGDICQEKLSMTFFQSRELSPADSISIRRGDFTWSISSLRQSPMKLSTVHANSPDRDGGLTTLLTVTVSLWTTF